MLVLCAPPLAAMSAGAAAWHLTQSVLARAGVGGAGSAANARAVSAHESAADTSSVLIGDTRFIIFSSSFWNKTKKRLLHRVVCRYRMSISAKIREIVPSFPASVNEK